MVYDTSLDLFVSSYQKVYGSSKAKINIKPQKAIVELDVFYDSIKQIPYSSIKYFTKKDDLISIDYCFTTMEEAVEYYNECIEYTIEQYENKRNTIYDEIDEEIDKLNKLKIISF